MVAGHKTLLGVGKSAIIKGKGQVFQVFLFFLNFSQTD
jgi:hypothetical protein